MPRPTSKSELLAAIEKERGALEAQLDQLSDEQKTMSGVVGDWSVKDVLAHLAAWEQMCLGWYEAGRRGEVPPLPAPGFKWNQTPALNRQIDEQHKDQPLAQVEAGFQNSHRQIMSVISRLSDEELFTPQRYAWTGKNAMGTYFVSATSSHYLWARKEIRKGLKKLGI